MRPNSVKPHVEMVRPNASKILKPHVKTGASKHIDIAERYVVWTWSHFAKEKYGLRHLTNIINNVSVWCEVRVFGSPRNRLLAMRISSFQPHTHRYPNFISHDADGLKRERLLQWLTIDWMI